MADRATNGFLGKSKRSALVEAITLLVSEIPLYFATASYFEWWQAALAVLLAAYPIVWATHWVEVRFHDWHFGRIEELLGEVGSLRLATGAAEREVARLRSVVPNLVGAILEVVAGTVGQDGAIGITMLVSVDNDGLMPTTIRGWQLEVRLSNGRIVKPALLHVPEKVSLADAGGVETEYTKDSLIYEKTSVTPIEVGGSRRGILVAVSSELSQSELFAVGTTCRVVFQDIKGREYSATHVMSGVPSPTKSTYYPGIS